MAGLNYDRDAGPKKTQRPIPPAGTHIGRCFAIIQTGTHEKEFKGVKTNVGMVQFMWELAIQPWPIFDQKLGPQPYGIFQEYPVPKTGKGWKKSGLADMLKSWRNISEMPRNIKLKEWLNAPCLINVVHTASKEPVIEDKTKSLRGDGHMIYANVSTVMSIPKDASGAPTMVCPATHNPLVFFDFETFNDVDFKKVPLWLKERIMKSHEAPQLSATYPQIIQIIEQEKAARQAQGDNQQQNMPAPQEANWGDANVSADGSGF